MERNLKNNKFRLIRIKKVKKKMKIIETSLEELVVWAIVC